MLIIDYTIHALLILHEIRNSFTTLICLKKGNVPWLRNLKKTLGPMYKQIEKSGCPMGFYTGPN